MRLASDEHLLKGAKFVIQKMSSKLPKTLLGQNRSSFTLINPSTQLYYRKLDRHGWLNNSTRQHITISYVWSEWIDDASESLPNWNVIRKRLLFILGGGASKSIRSETGGATRCWLDSKCIDQDSMTSKSYWIPRMDEIYAEAKCTVLLLRDPSLSVLVPVAQNMKCDIEGKAAFFHWPHSCLLSQSCTTFPKISIDQELACIEALKSLHDGAWKKRAWIFQEILLSKKFLLSLQDSEYIELGDIGVIANLLFQRHLNEIWLRDFSDWCRRLFYLRHFYAQSAFHHLSEANVLQMATGLQATVPADKIYALCGILKLKDVPYNVNHTADEAFQVVVGELIRKGRLSWLYAIPPPLNDECFHLAEANINSFVLTRLSDRFVVNRNKAYITNNSIGFPAMVIGQITRAIPLADLLQEAYNWMEKNHSIGFPRELEHLYFTPKIIRRIALDVVNPLLIDPLFGQICHGLGISKESGSRPTRAWRMIMSLYTKDVALEWPAAESTSSQEDQAAARLTLSAARSLQERLKILQDGFSVIWWQSDESNESVTLGLGPRTCTAGNYICSMKDNEQFLVAASLQSPNRSTATENIKSVDAHFRGAIYDLDSTMTFQWSVKVLVVHVVISPIDMQEPIFGDHPFWGRFKDHRYDKYITSDASKQESLLSLFGKVRNQRGRPVFLNLAYSYYSSSDHSKG